MIPAEIQLRLWAYMGGIARENGVKPVEIGGIDDHVHMLLSLPSSQPIAKTMREIKSASSRWMHETCNLRTSNGRKATARFPSEQLKSQPQWFISRTNGSIIKSAISRPSS